jgi:endonuclease YncB( thermonuclease family)
MYDERPDPWDRQGKRSLFDTGKPRRRREAERRRLWVAALLALAIGVVIGLVLPGGLLPRPEGWLNSDPPELIHNPDPPRKPCADTPTPLPVQDPAGPEAAVAAGFGFCAGRSGENCVIDGDTFNIGGETVRLAGIDTPEIGGAQCEDERRRGAAAEQRLHALLNAGPVQLVPAGDRDRDRFGRLLRDADVNGISVSEQMVAEGHARRWSGRKEPWC